MYELLAILLRAGLTQRTVYNTLMSFSLNATKREPCQTYQSIVCHIRAAIFETVSDLERKKANGSQPNIDKNMYRGISTARATAADRIAGRMTTLKNEPHHIDSMQAEGLGHLQ